MVRLSTDEKILPFQNLERMLVADETALPGSAARSMMFVIFDLPPANVYGDASILGPRLDAALIVIEADRTRITDAERTRRSLERVGVKLAGLVLNRRRSYIPAFLEEML